MIENSIGCITHYNQQHIQIRSDYQQICEFDHSLFADQQKRKEEPNLGCMAMILRVMETLTDLRHRNHSYAQEPGSREQPGEIPLELSNEALQKLTHRFFGATTIRNSVAMLIQKGFVKRVPNNKSRYPSYVFCTSVVQQALLHVALSSETSLPANNASWSENIAPTDFERVPTDFDKVPTDFERVPTDFERVPTDFGDNNIVSNIVSNINNKTTNTTAQFVESSVDVTIPITESPNRSTLSLEHPLTTPRPTTQSPSTPRPITQAPEPAPFQLSPEGECVYQRWCAVFGNLPFERKPALLNACEKLVPFHLTEDELRSMICYMRENDTKGYYKKRGIKLWDLPGEYPGWASIHRSIAAPPPPQAPSRKNLSDAMREARRKYE